MAAAGGSWVETGEGNFGGWAHFGAPKRTPAWAGDLASATDAGLLMLQ